MISKSLRNAPSALNKYIKSKRCIPCNIPFPIRNGKSTAIPIPIIKMSHLPILKYSWLKRKNCEKLGQIIKVIIITPIEDIKKRNKEELSIRDRPS